MNDAEFEALADAALARIESSIEESGLDADIDLKEGGVLGMVTYPVPGLQRYLDTFFDIAIQRGLDADFHVDETLDPTCNTLKTLAHTVLDVW